MSVFTCVVLICSRMIKAICPFILIYGEQSRRHIVGALRNALRTHTNAEIGDESERKAKYARNIINGSEQHIAVVVVVVIPGVGLFCFEFPCKCLNSEAFVLDQSRNLFGSDSEQSL